jgi:hypothetical protein
MAADLGALLQSGEGADVAVRCAGSKELRAHHLVLSARWQWFRSKHAFSCGVTEDAGAASAGSDKGLAGGQHQQRVVVTVDASEHCAATMQLVLQHLYTGRVSLQQHGTDDPVSQLSLLLVAASYFQLPDLHTACLQLAEQHLSPANALQWLVAAHTSGQQELEQAAMAYTLANIQGVMHAVYLTLDLCSLTCCLHLFLAGSPQTCWTGRP